MDWKLELLYVARVLIATFLGGLIGFERPKHHEAGIRTYAAVALGACAFTIISAHVSGGAPTRIASNVVTGVGFLGAGIIMRGQGHIIGLTTAATVWATAAVGLATGYGMYVIATLTSIILYVLLAVHRLPGWQKLFGIIDHEIEHRDGDT